MTASEPNDDRANKSPGTPDGGSVATGGDNQDQIEDKSQRGYDAAATANYHARVVDPDYQIETYTDDPWAVIGLQLQIGPATFNYELTAAAAEQLAWDILSATEGDNVQ